MRQSLSAIERKSTQEKLISKSIVDKVGGCRFWSLFKDAKGYGQIRFKGKTINVHRLAYLAFKGDIPDGLCVCHRCNNPACINPEHLYLDINAGNIRYRDECGRTAKGKKNYLFENGWKVMGEKNPSVQLTESRVREIFSLRVKGLTQVKIGKLVRISQPQISKILCGKEWPHIYNELNLLGE